MDLAGQLPEDLLVDVLGRLPPRSLAVCRSVRKAWRAAVDGGRLLRADHLRLSLHGVFLQLVDPGRLYRPLAPKLFSRQFTARDIADLRTLPLRGDMLDCCNGLLLLSHHVVNPATQQWASLPPVPLSCASASCYTCFGTRYLVFDPAVSLHYEVVLVPGIPEDNLFIGHISEHVHTDKSTISAMEWPPTSYIMHVFSSKTGEWKERSFVREGGATGTVRDRQSNHQYLGNYAAYCRGALYVPCEDEFVLRINMSSDKYQVVKLPEGKRLRSHAPRLGKSEKGVYCVFRYAPDAFEVWFLDESHGRMEWLLKNDINFDLDPKRDCTIVGGSWILQGDGINEELVEDNSEWDPNNTNVVSVDAWVGMPGPSATFHFLGFHPYIGIALFVANGSVMAYHLSTSKVRDLGYIPMGSKEIQVSLPYMPFWMGPLPGSS